jgi:ABC-type uncharacterized transport system permease subunit
MNNAISTLVAVFCCLLVGGCGLYSVHVALGEWSTLMWAGLGFLALMAACKRVNA